MKTATSSWIAAMGCAALVAAAPAGAQTSSRAQSVSEATSQSLLMSPAAASAPPGPASAPGAGWLRPRTPTLPSLRVIELPPEPQFGSANGRKHHALTWRNDTLSHALDEAGLARSECHNRVRLPSRLRSAPGSGRAVEVQLQLGLGCSF
jgi:hypothetical protein